MTMQRKTVTVVFCDVTGSTALGESTDPEALRALLARYFERIKGIVESHGGSVEKFTGDAVMAVFGVPIARQSAQRPTISTRYWVAAKPCRFAAAASEPPAGGVSYRSSGASVASRAATSGRPRACPQRP
jgi:class 3 adenylate cyclase